MNDLAPQVREHRMTSFRTFATAFFALAQLAFALEPASHFSNHMVLQREMKAPIWGTATPGAEVKVAFAGQTVSTKTDEAGKMEG